MCFTLFHVFSVFLPYSSSHIFHILHCIFSIFHSLQCLYLIFHVFQFSRHILWTRLCISHFPCFSVFLAIFQVVQCVFLISPLFTVFLAIYQVLPCDFLIFLTCHFSCHIPGPTVCVCVCVSFSTFFGFLAILQVL